jgi:hypothetical protein
MNKRGWIKIVEAFVAILLITGVVLVILSQENLVNVDLHSDIYESQLITLRDIQMNDDLRASVLGVSTPLESDDAGFPVDVKARIQYFALDYLECEAKICELESSCTLNNPPEKEVHAQTVAITSTSTTYDPKQLKLFCWSKL